MWLGMPGLANTYDGMPPMMEPDMTCNYGNVMPDFVPMQQVMPSVQNLHSVNTPKQMRLPPHHLNSPNRGRRSDTSRHNFNSGRGRNIKDGG